MIMATDIVSVIKSRLEIMGMSQAYFAKTINTTPTQMSIFLREKGSLTTERLNKSFDELGINISVYNKRNELAKEVAAQLIDKNVSSIDNWDKDFLSKFSGKTAILQLIDVKSKEEFLEIERCGIIDLESTYPFFKALVTYYMMLENDNPTASQAKTALSLIFGHKNEKAKNNLIKTTLTVGAAAALVNPIVGGLGTAIAIGLQCGAMSLFKKGEENTLYTKALEYLNK